MPKFLAHIDLALNQLKNAVLHPLSAAPGSPVEGQVYHDTTAHAPSFYDGGAWVKMDGSSRRLDQHAAPTAAVALNGQKLTGVGAPTASTDGATKGYVDTAVAGSTHKYAVLIGDGSTLAYTVTHNLNSLDVVVAVREASSGALVGCDVVAATVNTVTVTFAVAPAANAYSAIVVG
jgi:hypothetical protein